MPSSSTRSVPRLPNNLVIGPGKAGTSWIHQYLENRQDIRLPRAVKETFFFDRFFDRGVGWYASHFSSTMSARRTIEVAPSYFHHDETPQRIADTLGTLPLICTLREPAARTYSLYLHWQRYGWANGSMRQVIREYPVLIRSSKYATLLHRWISVFGKNSISVLFLENLVHDPENYAKRLCRILKLPFRGVDAAMYKPVNGSTVPPIPIVARFGKTAADIMRYWGFYRTVAMGKRLGLKPLFFGKPGSGRLPALDNDDRRWLAAQFADEIIELEELLNVDLSFWKEAPAVGIR